jgi:glycosyltransferase involved in cell wall biosynthesis
MDAGGNSLIKQSAGPRTLELEQLIHILFLTDNFPPEVNAPASRTHEHCKRWVAAGARVTVITCAPNFPTGRVFSGYRNALWQQEVVDGIQVIRVWSYITANEGFVKRILDYVSYMLSAWVASFFVRRVDVVVGTSPHFFTAVGAWAAAAVKRVPFVFELRDLWPESIKAVGAMRQSAVLAALERLELFLYRRAARIVSVTQAFKRVLMARGIRDDKIVVVTNGADSTRFSPRPKDEQLEAELGWQGCFVAGYIGTHGMAHALDTVLDAARALQADPNRGNFRFLLLGDGATKVALQQRAREQGLHTVRFVDTVPKEQVARYWSLLDASIIHLKRDPLFTTVIPSKLFECMAMGIPVLHGVEGESAELVTGNEVGIVFPPQDALALVAALRQLASDASQRERFKVNGPVAAKQYDRDTLAATMLEELRQVVAERRAA